MLAEKADRPHPLAFDSTKHKILNSELKHLYTAITRARVNVWIYDEDDEKRKPMFEYLKARRLAISKSVDQGKLLSHCFTMIIRSNLNKVFVYRVTYME